MGFDEPLKLRVKRRAHFTCCLCRGLYVEVHHIVPEAQGGPDTEDNAAPLCPSCHETYGANATKRKFIREARDLWYELCEERYKSVDAKQLERISEQLQHAATKAELSAAFESIVAIIQAQMAGTNVSVDSARQMVAHVTSSAVSSAAAIPVFGRMDLGDVFHVTGSAPPEGQPARIAEVKTPLG